MKQYDENAEKYGYEGEMTPLKCDELKVYVPQDGPYGLYPEGGGLTVEEETCYLKSEVDAAIAELKDKLQLDEDEMAGFLLLEEECGGGDLRNYIAELKAENKMLKEHIANGDVSRITWIDEATELKAENERLKDEILSKGRAYYKKKREEGFTRVVANGKSFWMKKEADK